MKTRSSAPAGRPAVHVQRGGAPPNAVDRLRTVEFRQTLRGYHIDDVDTYLEQVAVEVESLRQSERVHRAASPSASRWTAVPRARPSTAVRGRPQPTMAVVCCMDGRLEPPTLFGFVPGDAQVVRNAGGVVSDDVIRSLAISQRDAQTRTVLVVHHTDCALLRLHDEAFLQRLRRESGTTPPWHTGAFSDLCSSVRDSCDALRASPFLVYRDDIRGFVYDVDSGTLEQIDAPGVPPSASRHHDGSRHHGENGATWGGWW